MFRTLVSVEDLAAHLRDPKWTIVDCRHSLQDFSAGRREYVQAHIPGAFFADVENELAAEKTGKNGRHPLPGPEDFAALLREFGAHPDSQLVAYDAGGDMFAARFWFMARHAGHDAVAVLDGGFAAWVAAGQPVVPGETPRPKNGTIAAHPRHEITVNAQDVLASLETGDFTILDARGADRFAGQNETIDPVAGHIPGALNRPFKQNFDETGRFKSPAQLRAEFEGIGVHPKRLVHQCGSGVSASVNYLAMAVAGIEGSRLYPGSWSEWIADPARPIATG